jgi:hypothetical protein
MSPISYHYFGDWLSEVSVVVVVVVVVTADGGC